jgi:hypothetical protein
VLADARHLCGGLLLIGREHHPERGHDDVETATGEWQRLGIGLKKADVEPICLGAFAGAIEQCRHVIGGDHVAPTARRGERGVAVAGRDVEHIVMRANIERLAKLLADDLKSGADDGIVTGGPRSMLAALYGGEVR